MTAYVRERRVILEVPVAVDRLWNLGGCDVVWPDADEVARDGANATLACGLRGWEPHFEPSVGVFDVVNETIYRTSVFAAGGEVYLSLPAGGCRAVGIDAGATVGVGCAWVDERAVLVLRPDGGGMELGVHASGPEGGSQVRIAAARVAGVLGVGPGAVIRWVVSGEQLVGFPVRE